MSCIVVVEDTLVESKPKKGLFCNQTYVIRNVSSQHLSEWHSGTRTAVRVALGHSDNCPSGTSATRTTVRVALGHTDSCLSGTWTLGQLSEWHLNTRTAVRSTSDKVQSGLRMPGISLAR